LRITTVYSVIMNRKKAEKEVDRLIDKIRTIRLEKNISHEKLAEMSGLNRSTISLTESRKSQPTVLTLILIADALDIDLKEIL